MTNRIETDICIIGSGITGILTAARISELTDATGRRAFGDEPSRASKQQLNVVLVQAAHFSPKTLRAMMFNWISVVPPSMVLARLRSQS